MPPPNAAELPLIVTLVRLAVLPTLYKPPPTPPAFAVLPFRVTPVRMSVALPVFMMPAPALGLEPLPAWVEFALTVALVSDIAPPLAFRMPPPWLVAGLLLTIRLLPVTAPLFSSPAPEVAPLLVRVTSVSVRFAPATLMIPPPFGALLPLTVTF